MIGQSRCSALPRQQKKSAREVLHLRSRIADTCAYRVTVDECVRLRTHPKPPLINRAASGEAGLAVLSDDGHVVGNEDDWAAERADASYSQSSSRRSDIYCPAAGCERSPQSWRAITGKRASPQPRIGARVSPSFACVRMRTRASLRRFVQPIVVCRPSSHRRRR